MTGSNFEAPAILITGLLHPQVAVRLKSAFPLVHLAEDNTALLIDEMKAKVRGIASMGHVEAAFIDALPNLGINADFSVGEDAVDARHAGSLGTTATNAPDVLTE